MDSRAALFFDCMRFSLLEFKLYQNVRRWATASRVYGFCRTLTTKTFRISVLL